MPLRADALLGRRRHARRSPRGRDDARGHGADRAARDGRHIHSQGGIEGDLNWRAALRACEGDIESVREAVEAMTPPGGAYVNYRKRATLESKRKAPTFFGPPAGKDMIWSTRAP